MNTVIDLVYKVPAAMWCAAGVAVLTIGCGSGGNESEVVAPAERSSGAIEKRLVDREYPFTTIDGTELVCAEWEIVSASAILGTEREAYPVGNMNRHLANVGTADAVPHVDAAFRDALLEKGISRIQNCNQARAYVRLADERLQFRPVETFEPPAGSDPSLSVDPNLARADEEVDKIINGFSFDHPSTVGLGMGCTGQLIGPGALLTAAHCAPQGAIELRAWIQLPGGTQRCISHPGGGACPPAGGPTNAVVVHHPNYDGRFFDQEVILLSGGWLPPANTSTRWTRFAANWGLPLAAGISAAPIRIDGYGYNTTAGTGADVGRRGNSTHTITSLDGATLAFFQIPRLTAASSGTCGGDSGSGANNTTLLGGPNLSLGVHMGALTSDGKCVAPGATMLYAVPDGTFVTNVVTFFGGTCTTFAAPTNGLPYVQCW